MARKSSGCGERDEQQHGRDSDVQVDMETSEHVGGRGLKGKREMEERDWLMGVERAGGQKAQFSCPLQCNAAVEALLRAERATLVKPRFPVTPFAAARGGRPRRESVAFCIT